MLLLALIIIVVSGLIAYIGDLVGRKMGRKRLTMLGLRPRHTAIIISVGMGMLIAALTLVATMTVSGTIRESFFTPISTLKAKLRSLQQTVARADEEIKRTTEDASRVKQRFDEEARKLAETDRQLQASVRQRGRIQGQLASARRELGDVQARLAAKQRDLETARRRLIFAQTQYRQLRNDMDNTSASRTRTAQELLKLQDEEMRLQQMRDDLQEQVTTLTERVQLLTEFARGSFAPLAFTSGQELISGLMPMSENEQKLTAYLKQLVIAAEKVVRQRSPEMPADAPPLLFVGGSETRYVRLDAEEAVTSLARRIHGLGREMPIIIRLAPVNNVPVNGPALISVQTVELIPNATIYVAGEEIARVEVTSGGALTSAQALGLLVDDLLRVHVPEALRARGVPMITRRFDLRTPEQVPEASVSRVPWSELLAVAEQAAAHQGSIAIVAKAKTPITCYGPVDLTFAVLAREK